jgi:hypothetical protein
LAACSDETATVGDAAKVGVAPLTDDATSDLAATDAPAAVVVSRDQAVPRDLSTRADAPIAADTDAAVGCAARPDQAPCDDGDPCTVDDTCQRGAWKPGLASCACQTSADCTAFDDGNAGNGTLYCDKAAVPYTCKPNPKTFVTCPTGADSDCSKSQCDPKTGQCALGPVKDGTACDDGSPCTANDVCKGGQCKASSNPVDLLCACTASEDCADDGDLCNGVLYCDKASLPWGCKVNPKTVVQCKAANGKCQQAVCQPKTGQCVDQPLPDGLACDDANPCTTGDVCQAGACKPGTATCQCLSDADCMKQEDGDACNGTLFCNLQKLACQVNPATVVN